MIPNWEAILFLLLVLGVCVRLAFLWRKASADVRHEPKRLETIFVTHACPDCGNKELIPWEDSGHDISMACMRCGSAFGLQTAPFNIVERIRNPFLTEPN